MSPALRRPPRTIFHRPILAIARENHPSGLTRSCFSSRTRGAQSGRAPLHCLHRERSPRWLRGSSNSRISSETRSLQAVVHCWKSFRASVSMSCKQRSPSFPASYQCSANRPAASYLSAKTLIHPLLVARRGGSRHYIAHLVIWREARNFADAKSPRVQVNRGRHHGDDYRFFRNVRHSGSECGSIGWRH